MYLYSIARDRRPCYGGSYGMIFSPDGRTLVTATLDKALTFTHVSTGEELLRVENVGIVNRIEFSDRDRFLACRSEPHDSTLPFEIVVLDGFYPSDEDDASK